MAIESTGHSQGNPRLYELVEHTPKTGKSPTIWAWPEVIDFFRVAGQPVPGPWPPHQQRRPDPEEESLPTAVPDPQSSAAQRPASERSEPQTSEPQTSEPQTSEPQTSEPQTSEPQTSEPQTSEPQISEPQHAAPEDPASGRPDYEPPRNPAPGRGYLDK